MEYRLNLATKQCEKRPARGEFRPIEVPPGAKRVNGYVLGLETTVPTIPGLEVESYSLENEGHRMIIDVTKTGCIPVHMAEFDEQRPGFYSSQSVKQ